LGYQLFITLGKFTQSICYIADDELGRRRAFLHFADPFIDLILADQVRLLIMRLRLSER